MAQDVRLFYFYTTFNYALAQSVMQSSHHSPELDTQHLESSARAARCNPIRQSAAQLQELLSFLKTCHISISHLTCKPPYLLPLLPPFSLHFYSISKTVCGLCYRQYATRSIRKFSVTSIPYPTFLPVLPTKYQTSVQHSLLAAPPQHSPRGRPLPY